MSEQGQNQAGRGLPNPYIGPRSFQRGETLYGRDFEQHHLLDLLIAERIVLLHSPSGAGKTSLIQAGLIPELEEAAFFVLPVMRVSQELPADLFARGGQTNGAQAEPNRYILSALLELEAGVPPELRRDPASLVGLTFDDYLRQYPRPDNAPDNIVLIFDQFEEILTADPANIAAKNVFFAQLGVALRDRSRWLLCSMREDHVAGLDPYVRLVPTRLGRTFRLDLLGVDGAREAAMRPAADAGAPFDATTVQHLIDDLRRMHVQRFDGTSEEQLGPNIEPVHLQVVFRRLWEQVQSGSGQLDQTTATAGSDVDSALSSYYEQEIQEVVAQTGVSERAIRKWFDYELITEQGIRNQVRQGLGQSDGLDNNAIRALIDSHLVRSEQRLGATWFELAHDRLIKPIRTSNAIWNERHLSLLQRQALLWTRQGRPKGMLLHDEAFDEIERWADSHADVLTTEEQEFLAQCRQARDERQREVAYNQLRDVAYSRARLLIVALALLLLALIAVGWTILQQERAARVQELIARIQQLASQAREVSGRFPQRGLLIAIEAVRLAEASHLAQPAAQESLHTTLAAIGGTPLIGHTDTVRALAFRPGGQLLATGSADGSARLWRVDAPEHATSVLRGHTLGIAALAFSHDGQLLATGGDDGSARLWRVDAPEHPLAVFSGHTLSVNALAFSPDGQLLATGDLTGTARLWQVGAPQAPPIVLQSSQARDPSETTQLVFGFSRDGKLFAVGGSDGQVQLLRMATPLEAPDILRESGTSITALVFSPDGSTLAVSLSDGAVLLWRFNTNEGQPVSLGAESQQISKPISAFAFSPDGTMLATGSLNGTVALWKLDASAPTVLGRHAERVSALAFSPAQDYLAAGSDDGTTLLWPIEELGSDPTVLRGHEAPVDALAFSDDGRYLATGSDDTTARLRSLGAPQSEPTLLRNHTTEIRAVAFNADSSMLVSASSDGTILGWGLDGSVPQHTVVREGDGGLYVVAMSPNKQWLATAGFIGTSSEIGVEVQQVVPPGQKKTLASPGLSLPILQMALFSPDNRLLALGGSDGRAFIWQLDAPQSAPIVVDSGGSGTVVLAFSPNGQMLATGGSNGTIRLWRTNAQAAPIDELHDHTEAVVTMAFTSDGSTLATGSNDGTVRLWKVAESQPSSTVLLSRDSVVSVLTFSQDGGMLATGYGDGTVWLWDASAPESAPTQLSGGHRESVVGIAFSADGDLLATGSEDTTTHLWQLSMPNAEPVVLSGHHGSVSTLAFSSDASYLATGSQDTTLGLWRLNVDDLIMRACATVGRNLSVQEQQGLGLTGSGDDRRSCGTLPLHPSVYTTWLLQDNVDMALAAYTTEQQRDPTLEPPPAWLVRQAAELLRRGRLEQALALFNRARQTDARLDMVDVQSLNQFCRTGTSGRFIEALDACDRAVTLAPENGDYRFNRGIVRRHAGDLAGAIQDFEVFLTIVADQPNAGGNLLLARQWIDEMQQEIHGPGLPTPAP